MGAGIHKAVGAVNDVFQTLSNITVLEVLEQDPRPTFILDLHDVKDHPHYQVQSVACNNSLRSFLNLEDAKSVTTNLEDRLTQHEPGRYREYKEWAVSFATVESSLNGKQSWFPFGGLLWSRSTLRKRWRIISGSAVNLASVNGGTNDTTNPSAGVLVSSLKANYTGSDNDLGTNEACYSSVRKALDVSWTTTLPPNEHTQLFRNTNWEATALGPLETWPSHLRQMTRLLMSDSRAASLFWGPQKVVVYNEAYTPVASRKHPGMMGSTFAQAWSEVANEFPPIFEKARRTRHASTSEAPFFIHRNGILEETFFSVSMAPIYSDSGELEGFYNTVFETTRQILSDRRTRTLMSIRTSPDLSSFWHDVLVGFESNKLDIPLALIYSLDRDPKTGSCQTSTTCSFEAATGMSEDHPLLIKNLNLENDQQELAPLFKKVMTTGSSVILRKGDGTLPESLTKDVQWRGFPEPSTTAVVLPLCAGDEVRGFLLLGLNPRRIYDEDYQSFIQLLSRQLLTSLTSTTLIEQAGLNEANLASQLVIRTREVAETESRFKALAELTPIGMFYMSPIGEVLYANDTWYEMTGHPKALCSKMSFMDVLLEEDRPLMEKEWHNLTVLRMKRTIELRLKKKWYHQASNSWRNTWILASASHEENKDGTTLKSIMGCITNISLQKQAQEDALARAALSEQLTESEKKFKQMAELSPCGMFYITPDGQIEWANSQWYEMTGHSRDPQDHYPMSFYGVIEAEDHPLIDRTFERLTVEKKAAHFEFRLTKRWINTIGSKSFEEATWLLGLAVPQLNEDGSVKSIMGVQADISKLKWAESLQMRSRIEAEEARKSQEKFMDITSHEMRNPLSAILQSADGIAKSLTEFQSSSKTLVMSGELVESNLEAVEIITLCAQHQSRIINDVLTLSKLDSEMLQVAPVVVQPLAVVKGALKMFEGELLSHNISLDFVSDQSYAQFDIDWVMADPSRVTQIFINLMTNAIKFTQAEAKRSITVNIGAAVKQPPKDRVAMIDWFPSRATSRKRDLTLDPDWGKGEQVFIYFAVQDTGRGLSKEEKKLLFHRFSQANPRTHVQYGGSGLGLFISRELTELQGGEIGVESEAGKGSTFAFYIKGRRATSPLDEASYQDNPFKRVDQEHNSPRKAQKTELSIATEPPPLPISLSRQPTETDVTYNVLLVEDNLVNQRVLGKQLKKAGCKVTLANHGQECLDFLETTNLWKGNDNGCQMDIILMDMEMPVMNGLEATQHIRDLQRQGSLIKHVPIIAVTANARKEQIEISLKAGMDDVMPKPFRIAELIPKMQKLMSELEKFDVR